LLIDNLFTEHCCFNKLNEEFQNLTLNQTEAKKTKSNLFIDNVNLLLRHYDNNPFKLIKFLLDSSRKSEIGTICMVLHEDSIDEVILSQFGSVFQTIIQVNDTKMKLNEINEFSKLKSQVFKFHLQIEHRNLKKGKVYPYVKTSFLVY
jgi:hypothetical protein